MQSADAFRQLLGQFDWLGAYSPPLQTCLQTFSGRPCPQVESVFSWSTAKFGLRPLSTLTHTMIQKSSLAGKPAVFIALKQIYADHYFDAALGLAVLGEDSAEPSHPAVWLAYVERSQTDDLQSCEIEALSRRSEVLLGCVDAEAELEMKAVVDEVYRTGDTVGGIFEVVAHGLPPGLGSHITWDSRLDGKLAQAIVSMQAVKGVEVAGRKRGPGVSVRKCRTRFITTVRSAGFFAATIAPAASKAA